VLSTGVWWHMDVDEDEREAVNEVDVKTECEVNVLCASLVRRAIGTQKFTCRTGVLSEPTHLSNFTVILPTHPFMFNKPPPHVQH